MAKADRLPHDEAELAVLAYLDWLIDPTKTIDIEAVAKIDAQLEGQLPVMDRLRLLSSRWQQMNIDEESLRDAFVASVRDWATEEDVPASAFQAMNVPMSVLAEAGMMDLPKAPKSTKVEVRKVRMPAYERNMAPEAIVKYLQDQGSATVRQLSEGLNYTIAMSKLIIDQLIEEGRVKEEGITSAHRGRGARVYGVADPS